MCVERTKEQVQAKNRNKYKTRTNRRTTPHNQTRRQAGGFFVTPADTLLKDTSLLICLFVLSADPCATDDWLRTIQ